MKRWAALTLLAVAAIAVSVCIGGRPQITETANASFIVNPYRFGAASADPYDAFFRFTSDATTTLVNSGTSGTDGANGAGAAAMTWTSNTYVYADDGDYGNTQHPIASFESGDPWTVAMWVRFKSGDMATLSYFFGADSGGNNELLIYKTSTDTITTKAKESDGTQEFTEGSVVLSVDTWYHVAYVYNGSNLLTLYVNGEVDATDATAYNATVITNSHPFWIGGHNNAGSLGASDMNGDVDDFLWDDTALASNVIYTIWQAERSD